MTMRSNPAAAENRRRQAGFTLIEMGVVIFVMAILLGSILVPLSNQVEQRQLTDTQRQLEEIREALIGYALAQARPTLPCPDKTAAVGAVGTPNDGREDFDALTGACMQDEGNVPWATLGLGAADAWGNRIRYRVSPDYANHVAGISLGMGGTLRICESAPVSPGVCSDSITESATPANMPAAVLVSHGVNRWGAIAPATGTQILPPGCASPTGCGAMSTNEIENANGTVFFVSRPPSPAGSGAGTFDDVVVWLSPHVLKQRLVAGGKLP